MLVAVDHVPIRTNPKTRESRLFPSMWAYVRRNSVSIFRIYAMYEPLRVFMTAAAIVGARRARSIWAPLTYLPDRRRRQRPRPVADPRRGAVHRRGPAGGARRDGRHPRRQPRSLQQRTLERVRRVELQLGVEPSHYEPGSLRAPEPRPARARPPTSSRPASERRSSCDAGHRRRGGPHRQHLRQVRLDQPGRRRLMAGFHGTLDELWHQAAPSRSSTWAAARACSPTSGPSGSATGGSSASTSTTRSSRPSGRSASAPTWSTGSRRPPRCSFADGEFDMATAIEVLEHVPDPRRRVAEMARVAQQPAARVGAARAAVARAEHGPRRLLEGPRQHARPREPLVEARFVALLSRHGDRRGDALAVPVDDVACPRLRSSRGRTGAKALRELRARRGDPVGGDRRHRAHHVRATSRWRQPHAVGGRVRRDHAAVVGGVHHRLGALPAGGAAAVAHDRRPRRARADRQRAPARGRDDPARARPRCSWSSRWRSARRSQDNLFDGSARSTGS